MTKSSHWTGALGLALALGISLGAQSARSEEKGNGPCKDDVEKFCKDVKPGEGRIMKCLKEHESELSAACQEKKKERKEARKEKREEFKKDCEADVQQFCKDVKPGEGRIINCLKEHESQVSQACKDAMPKRQGAVMPMPEKR